jgi:hypothetical protein
MPGALDFADQRKACYRGMTVISDRMEESTSGRVPCGLIRTAKAYNRGDYSSIA